MQADLFDRFQRATIMMLKETYGSSIRVRGRVLHVPTVPKVVRYVSVCLIKTCLATPGPCEVRTHQLSVDV